VGDGIFNLRKLGRRRVGEVVVATTVGDVERRARLARCEPRSVHGGDGRAHILSQRVLLGLVGRLGGAGIAIGTTRVLGFISFM